MTVQLLSAYFANNQVPADDIPGIIGATRAALERRVENEPAALPEFVPAVSIRKSLSSHDHIISLIDGKPYKSLKRHLGSHGLTPDDYRARYKLASDYPMVAPGYSEHRREVAKQLGLGRKKAVSKDIAAPVEAEQTEVNVRAKRAGKAGTVTGPTPSPVPAAEVAPKGKTGKQQTKAKASLSRPAVIESDAVTTTGSRQKVTEIAKPRALKRTTKKKELAPGAQEATGEGKAPPASD